MSVVFFLGQVDLQPSGKVMMAVQYFLEEMDAGKGRLNKICSFLKASVS